MTASLVASVGFETSSEYHRELSEGSSKTTTRSTSFVLDGGNRYTILKWGTQLIPQADYLLNFRHHEPLVRDSVAKRNATITAATDSTETFFVVLSSADYSNQLLNQPCIITAQQYLSGVGEFADGDSSLISYDLIPEREESTTDENRTETDPLEDEEVVFSAAPMRCKYCFLTYLLIGALVIW